MDNEIVLVMMKVRELVKKYEDSKGQIPIPSDDITGMKSFLRKAEMLGRYDVKTVAKIKSNLAGYTKAAEDFKIEEELRQRRKRGARKQA